jgi:hypothetical protein
MMGGVCDEALVFPRLGYVVFGGFFGIAITVDNLLESRSTKRYF